MTVAMEFKTTEQDRGKDPIPPKGDGWMLAGTATDAYSYFGGVHMYWQRPVEHKARECSNHRCQAVAFVDGACVGCGTPLED